MTSTHTNEKTKLSRPPRAPLASGRIEAVSPSPQNVMAKSHERREEPRC